MQTYSDLLDAFISRPGQTEADLAARIDKTQPAVHRYRKGKRFPDAETARRIDAATSGEVPFSAWQSDFMARSGIAA